MQILLIGASVRAAAFSLRRSGGEPIAFDLFRDADLVAVADATQLTGADYPTRIADRLVHLPPIPWIFTGAIENHPAVVAMISRRFPLLGTPPVSLRLVRDHSWLAETVRQAGLRMPETRDDPAQVPTDGSWLVKPVASGGGEGVALWFGQTLPAPDRVVFQVRKRGVSLGATMIRESAGTRLVGVSRQYLGRPGNRWAYRGSLAPWLVSEAVRDQVVRLGRAVGDAAGLRGLFGMDLIVTAGQVWLIEVNPRYTASVELLETATGRSILAEHLRACDPTLAVDPEPMKPAAPVVAKEILFARSAGRWAGSVPAATPGVADIPHPGTRFEVGQPIMTVFGGGVSIAACQRDLVRRLRAYRARIEVARP